MKWYLQLRNGLKTFVNSPKLINYCILDVKSGEKKLKSDVLFIQKTIQTKNGKKKSIIMFLTCVDVLKFWGLLSSFCLSPAEDFFNVLSNTVTVLMRSANREENPLFRSWTSDFRAAATTCCCEPVSAVCWLWSISVCYLLTLGKTINYS